MPSSLPATPASQTAAQPIPAATINNHRDNLNFLLSPPRFIGRYTAGTLSVATGSGFTSIPIDTEDKKVDLTHGASAGSVTINTPGDYLIIFSVEWTSNATGYRTAQVEQNGAQPTGRIGSIIQAANGTNTLVTTSGILSCAAADVISFWGQQSSGGGLVVVAARAQLLRVGA